MQTNQLIDFEKLVEEKVMKNQPVIDGCVYDRLTMFYENKTVCKVDIKNCKMEDSEKDFFQVIELTTHPSLYFESFASAVKHAKSIIVKKLQEYASKAN